MYDWGNIYSKKTGKMLNQKYVGLKAYLNKTVYSPWIRDWFEGQRALRHTIQAPHIYAAAYAVASGCCISVPVLASFLDQMRNAFWGREQNPFIVSRFVIDTL